MNSLDIFFIIVLAFFLLRGIFRGLVQEISSVVGLLLGFFLANKYYSQILPYVTKIIPDKSWAQIASYLGIFLGVMALVVILSIGLKSLLRCAMLGWLDRIGGGGLGLIKASLICSITLLVLTSFLPTNTQFIHESKLAPYVHNVTKILGNFLPQELKEKFNDQDSSIQFFWKEDWIEKLKKEKERFSESR
ncbi:CvpA family protein [Desulfohalobiaceae bacterium Ax17]|jgi:membrane protein required for colicin V production|uniref:CvpA family protein n=1 Tax=Desulfovulcanus ferrireducens TaxID=2831190 RepID=UPI00207B9C06|nr:CvpA family protein [Desulfovulcanus ferrireducens]MBT8763648.1 CvpA family protein [Desulfovulcanus ferrireducens]